SSVAPLTVNGPPLITGQPSGQSVLAGVQVSFTVGATGTAPLGYQWRYNGAPITEGGQFAGTTAATLFINNVAVGNAGAYTVVVSNFVGSVTSSVANLSVTAPGSCFPAPAGLIGWWPGEGSANDIAGANNGTLSGGANAAAGGEVGLAF